MIASSIGIVLSEEWTLNFSISTSSNFKNSFFSILNSYQEKKFLLSEDLVSQKAPFHAPNNLVISAWIISKSSSESSIHQHNHQHQKIFLLYLWWSWLPHHIYFNVPMLFDTFLENLLYSFIYSFFICFSSLSVYIYFSRICVLSSVLTGVKCLFPLLSLIYPFVLLMIRCKGFALFGVT